MVTAYLNKMRGFKESPPRVPYHEVFFSWVGALIGIGAVSYINYNILDGTDLVMIIGSFGASAVLIYGVTNSPLAQPRNLVGGHIISALVGVTVQMTMGDIRWLAGAVAVATAIAVMQVTRTTHPPGGATAYIAVIGSAKIHNLGYLYALVPAASGAIIMLLVALVVNNLSSARRYPEYWL
jgi:CBS-domain-containing membrane protein